MPGHVRRQSALRRAVIHLPHLRDYVVRPTLEALELWSDAAERLVLGTAAHESNLEYLEQVTGANDTTLGPALGLYQMERATYVDLVNRVIPLWARRSPRRRWIDLYFEMMPHRFAVELRGWPPERMVGDLYLATAACRIRYWIVPEALPAADDVPALASYWKRHYNTLRGKGRVDDWIRHYERLVLPHY
jgi:hypothetical protein